MELLIARSVGCVHGCPASGVGRVQDYQAILAGESIPPIAPNDLMDQLRGDLERPVKRRRAQAMANEFDAPGDPMLLDAPEDQSEELEPDIDLEHASVDPPRGRCAAPCDLCNRRPCMIVADHDPSYHRGQCRCAVALRGLDCTAERFRPRRPMFIDLDWQTSTPGRQAVEERSVAMTRFCQTWNKHLLLLLLSGAGGSRRWFRQC